MGTGRTEGTERPASTAAGFDAFGACGIAARAGEPTTELRGECPRWIVDVLDAVVMARGGQSANVHRSTVWVEVMAAWAEKKVHEASLIQRLAAVHPTGSESSKGADQ